MKFPRLTTLCIVFFGAAIVRYLMYTFPPEFFERQQTQKSRTKVLLLSYTRYERLWRLHHNIKLLLFRSGSSLLGELLSLHSSSSYIFEPYKKFDLTCEEREDSSSLRSFFNETLGGFLTCDHRQINKLKQKYRTPESKACNTNPNYFVNLFDF